MRETLHLLHFSREGLSVKRLKIMFFFYRLGGGGAARTILNIVNHLDRTKFEPILVTLDFTYDYEQYVKDDVTFIKLPTKRLRKSMIPLAKLIRNERPDVLFSTVATYNVITILAKLLSLTNVRVIVREAALLGGTKREDRKLKVYGFLYKFANRVVALSEGVKENVIKKYNVKEDKLTVIYNPVDLSHIDKQSTNERLPENLVAILKQNERLIVTAGRLVEEKDQRTLLNAFQLVRREMNCQLAILGEGELEEDLKRYATDLGIANDVHFVGFQQNPYVFFKHADVFALTSRSEGFGHVLVEALATKTPIATTRCNPGADEVLANGEYGKVCDVGDAETMAQHMIELLNLTEAERTKIVEKGRKRANQFAVEKIVEQYERLFRETADS